MAGKLLFPKRPISLPIQPVQITALAPHKLIKRQANLPRFRKPSLPAVPIGSRQIIQNYSGRHQIARDVVQAKVQNP